MEPCIVGTRGPDALQCWEEALRTTTHPSCVKEYSVQGGGAFGSPPLWSPSAGRPRQGGRARKRAAKTAATATALPDANRLQDMNGRREDGRHSRGASGVGLCYAKETEPRWLRLRAPPSSCVRVVQWQSIRASRAQTSDHVPPPATSKGKVRQVRDVRLAMPKRAPVRLRLVAGTTRSWQVVRLKARRTKVKK